MAIQLSRPGQANLSGDPKVLFLRKFAGEVLTAYREYTVMASRTMLRTIDNGKSAVFPATGKTTGQYHTPGTDIDTNLIASNEVEIFIDDMFMSNVLIYDIDQAMAHWDFRQEYVRLCAEAVARNFDINLIRIGLLTARASANVTGGNGGTRIVNANVKTDPVALMQSLSAAQLAMNQKDVAKENRYCVLPPETYQMMLDAGSSGTVKLTSRDYDVGGSIRMGRIWGAYGFEFVESNNFQNTNVTTGPAKYQGNFSTSAALCFHRSAFGTVQLKGMKVESDYLILKQADIVVCKNAVGHGKLRPEAAVELATGVVV